MQVAARQVPGVQQEEIPRVQGTSGDRLPEASLRRSAHQQGTDRYSRYARLSFSCILLTKTATFKTISSEWQSEAEGLEYRHSPYLSGDASDGGKKSSSTAADKKAKDPKKEADKVDKDTRVNGKSMTDTMSDLYKNNSGAKKALQTISIDKKGDEKLLGCVSDLVEGQPWITTEILNFPKSSWPFV